MALETTKQFIEVETLIGAQYSQALVRAEALVPGAGRAAIEPLMAEANVSVSGADVQTDRIVLQSTVCLLRQSQRNAGADQCIQIQRIGRSNGKVQVEPG